MIENKGKTFVVVKSQVEVVISACNPMVTCWFEALWRQGCQLKTLLLAHNRLWQKYKDMQSGMALAFNRTKNRKQCITYFFKALFGLSTDYFLGFMAPCNTQLHSQKNVLPSKKSSRNLGKKKFCCCWSKSSSF